MSLGWLVAACHSSYRAISIIQPTDMEIELTFTEMLFINCHCSCWMYFFSATPCSWMPFWRCGPPYACILWKHTQDEPDSCFIQMWQSQALVFWRSNSISHLRAGSFNMWDHNCNSVLNTWNVLFVEALACMVIHGQSNKSHVTMQGEYLSRRPRPNQPQRRSLVRIGLISGHPTAR